MCRIACKWQSRCFLFQWKVLLEEACLRDSSPRYMPLRPRGFWRASGSPWVWTASGSCDALLTVTSFFSINNKKENSGDGECGSAQTTATVLVSVCCSRSQPRIGTIIVLHPEWVRYASSRCSGERRCSRKLHQQEELLAAFYREEE